MNKNVVIIFVAMTVIALNAKGQIPYEPNAITIPLLKCGPAINIGYYYGGIKGSDGIITFALNKRFRLFGSYFRNDQNYIGETPLFNDPKHYVANAWTGEFGIGYRIGSTVSRNIFECYCGLGRGYIYGKEFWLASEDRPLEKWGNYRKSFVQANYRRDALGMRLSFACRLMYLWFQDYRNTEYMEVYSSGTSYLSANTTEYNDISFVNIEPTVQLGVGNDWLEVFILYGIPYCVKPYMYIHDENSREILKIGKYLLKAGVMGTVDFSFMLDE